MTTYEKRVRRGNIHVDASRVEEWERERLIAIRRPAVPIVAHLGIDADVFRLRVWIAVFALIALAVFAGTMLWWFATILELTPLRPAISVVRQAVGG